MKKTVDEQIATNAATGEKPTLLLHCCCAPCASVVLERLTPYFSVTAYFCNPNITEKSEYDKRLAELQRLCDIFSVPVLDEGYSADLFLSRTKGLESEPERGKRCKICFFLRLGNSAKRAASFDYFATTLTLSPLKDAAVINQTGEELSEIFGTQYLSSDFKKKDGFKRSVELSAEFGLYRQDYCGCIFSKRSAH